MRPEQVVEREQRSAGQVALAAILAGVLAIAGFLIPIISIEGGTDAEAMRSIDSHAALFVAGGALQGIGFALLVFPLLYLFRAARSRTDAVRSSMIGFVFLGPLLFAAHSILYAVVLTDIAGDFVSQAGTASGDLENLADRLLEDSSARDFARALALPGLLGMVVAMVYIPLHSMRVGLLTRFWGSLGMALGVGLLFLSPVPLMLWFIYVGVLFLDRLPGGRPPAWEEGRAIPWPKPGEEPPERSKEPESRAEDQA